MGARGNGNCSTISFARASKALVMLSWVPIGATVIKCLRAAFLDAIEICFPWLAEAEFFRNRFFTEISFADEKRDDEHARGRDVAYDLFDERFFFPECRFNCAKMFSLAKGIDVLMTGAAESVFTVEPWPTIRGLRLKLFRRRQTQLRCKSAGLRSQNTGAKPYSLDCLDLFSIVARWNRFPDSLFAMRLLVLLCFMGFAGLAQTVELDNEHE